MNPPGCSKSMPKPASARSSNDQRLPPDRQSEAHPGSTPTDHPKRRVNVGVEVAVCVAKHKRQPVSVRQKQIPRQNGKDRRQGIKGRRLGRTACVHGYCCRRGLRGPYPVIGRQGSSKFVVRYGGCHIGPSACRMLHKPYRRDPMH